LINRFLTNVEVLFYLPRLVLILLADQNPKRSVAAALSLL
jgi:hypothetical protein